jgi:hypothetical protein
MGRFFMGLRGPKARGEKDWYKQVAQLMVNECMGFSVACQALGLKFTTSQEEREHEYSEAFRNLLTGLHLDFFVEIGANPQIGKEYVKGVAVYTIRKLAESDQFDKMTAPLKELSDVLGLTRETADTPVLANLTQADIDEVRAKLKAKDLAQETDSKALSAPPDKKPN